MHKSMSAMKTFMQQTPRKFCRDFGFLLAILFLFISLWVPGVGFKFRPSYLAVALILSAIGLYLPNLLRPLASLWRGLAVVLHTLMSPLILFVLYFFILTPVGLALRLFGWDPLRLKPAALSQTHWIKREPGPRPESFKQQF